MIENVQKGIPRVMAYIDNILLIGLTEEAHLQTPEKTGENRTQAKMSKFQFMEPSVSCLGHRIDAEGLHPLPDKVQAVVDAPDPQNVQELKSYLGLLSYYGKFFSNLLSVLASLYRLLRKDYRWRWSAVERAAFKSSKELLTSSKLLVHYDPHLDLVLACDASAYGVGAVLAHRLPDGTERPIGYASRSLHQNRTIHSWRRRDSHLFLV